MNNNTIFENLLIYLKENPNEINKISIIFLKQKFNLTNKEAEEVFIKFYEMMNIDIKEKIFLENSKYIIN